MGAASRTAGADVALRSGPVAAVLADAGWKVSVTDDFVTAAWHKLLTNAVSGLMVLTMRAQGCSAATTCLGYRACTSRSA